MTTEDVCDVFDGILMQTERIDWLDPRRAHPFAANILDRLSQERQLLGAVIGRVTAAGARGCEHFPHLDKLLLWSSDNGSLRLRLHVFHPGYFDRPHNHRWSFHSRVLCGRYLHSLYGSEDEVLRGSGAAMAPTAKFVHDVPAGMTYFLDHTMVHSLSTDAVTVSLVLRGPAVKDRYFTLDGAPGEVRWSVGAAVESASERDSKVMTPERLQHVLQTLSRQGVL